MIELPEPPPSEATPETPSPRAAAWPHTCDNHPGVPAWASCARCGRFVCRACRQADPATEHALCPQCLHALVRPAAATDSATALEPAATSGPGDEPTRVAEYPATARRLLTGPSAFFERMRAAPGSLVHAAGFGIACSIIGALAGIVWGSVLGDAEPMLLAAREESGLPTWLLFAGVLAALPLAAALEIALFAVGLFAMLRVMRVEGASFAAVFRVASYAMVARLFIVLPAIGAFLAILAQVLLLQIGVRRGVGAPFDRTLVAVLVTVLVLGMLGFAAA